MEMWTSWIQTSLNIFRIFSSGAGTMFQVNCTETTEVFLSMFLHKVLDCHCQVPSICQIKMRGCWLQTDCLVLVLRSKQQQISHDFKGIHKTSVKRSIKWSTCTLYHTNRIIHQRFGMLDNHTSHSLNHHPYQSTVTHRYEIQGKTRNRSDSNDSPHRTHSQHLLVYGKSL